MKANDTRPITPTTKTVQLETLCDPLTESIGNFGVLYKELDQGRIKG
jgi:hypothetical protein